MRGHCRHADRLGIGGDLAVAHAPPGGRLSLAETVARLKERVRHAPAKLDGILADLLARGDARREHLRWVAASRGQETTLITVDEIVYFRAENKYTVVMTADGEALIRAEVAKYFPDLAQQPGRVYSRPVSFSVDRLPIAGPVPGAAGFWPVNGLVSPPVYLPSPAPRVAAALDGESVPENAAFAPARLPAGA